MNIWILNHYAIPPSLGGLTRHYYFSKFLGKKGHKVRIFTSSMIHNTKINMVEGKELYREQITDGIEYTFVRAGDYHANGFSRIKNMLDFPLNLWRLRNTFERPDVIYTSSPDLFAAFAAIHIAKQKKVSCVVEVRDLWPESIIEYKGISRKNPVILVLQQLEKWIYKKADRIIFTMEGGKDYIVQRGWQNVVDLEKVYHVNNGVDIEEFDHNRDNCRLEHPQLLNPDTFKVVYTGSVRMVNNLKPLVEAAKLLKERAGANIQFLVYGDGNEREELQRYANEISADNIAFLGHVDKKYIPFILSQSDLNLIHVKQTDIMRFGCSLNKLFDYLASGKPILSDLVCRYDLIERCDCGVVIKQQTAAAIAHAVMDFYNADKEKQNRWGANARQAALEYDYPALTAKLEQVLCIIKE